MARLARDLLFGLTSNNFVFKIELDVLITLGTTLSSVIIKQQRKYFGFHSTTQSLESIKSSLNR